MNEQAQSAEALIGRMPAVLSVEEKKLITDAFAFSKEAHEGQKRMSGEPYFNHVYAAALKLAEIGMGPQTIAAGLLHDTIEDCDVAPQTIAEKFGDEVLFLVEGVTKLGTLKYRGVERHVESLRKLFVATSQDVRVLIIRLMDRLHNMETLSFVREDKQRRIALETLEIYVPIADRLGMGSLKRQLEDLAFPYVYPKEHAEIYDLMEDRKGKALKNLENVQQRLRKELVKNDLVEFNTSTRIKGLYSLWKKMSRKDNDIENVYDIAAVRVIVKNIDDCYRALGVVHACWRPLPGRIKDYIAFPKPNGYRSLHTTIFSGDGSIIEVQIRTEEMHNEAQWGIASHFTYKNMQGGKKEPSSFLWLRQLLPGFRQSTPKAAPAEPVHYSASDMPRWIEEIAAAQQETAEGHETLLTELKGDFFNHRVFVFTPKGDVIDLPVESCPIDFAYAIHSDIGNHLSGAKVNGKLVSLDSKLKNGDIVEIETKKSSKPTHKWLDVVKTSLARKHIRQVLEEARQ